MWSSVEEVIGKYDKLKEALKGGSFVCKCGIYIANILFIYIIHMIYIYIIYYIYYNIYNIYNTI